MKTKSVIIILLFLILLFIVSGCATTKPTINDIPHTSEDFQTPVNELVAKYPLMAPEQQKFPLHSFNSQAALNGLRIPVQLLEDNWGEPAQIENGSWLWHLGYIATAHLAGYVMAGAPPVPLEVHLGIFGGFYLYAPLPVQTYTWIKGEHCINARAIRNGNTYYSKVVTGWIWENKKECLNTANSKNK